MLKVQLHSQRKLIELLSFCFTGQPFPPPLLCRRAPHPFPCLGSSTAGQARLLTLPKTKLPTGGQDSLLERQRSQRSWSWLLSAIRILQKGDKDISPSPREAAGSGDRDLGVIYGGRRNTHPHPPPKKPHKTRGRNTHQGKGQKAFNGLNSLPVRPP